ncbi:hypothetical protein ElyMa_002314600 [Elysia marginata]|uniref:DUF4758 domain-containing protein n=1 Tax=Elysia marginata TaxID=1093978 RepID=A0AAV4G5E2_9GAST|nr:hypothetical protein ElyMa_002314600 [Elysia marginata]
MVTLNRRNSPKSKKLLSRAFSFVSRVKGHVHNQNGNVPNGNAYALRNVGTQTEPTTPTPQRTRYTKKMLKPTLSNQYKEKVAAVRKKSGSTTTSAATKPSLPSATISIVSAPPQGETLRAGPGRSSLVFEETTPMVEAPSPVLQQAPPSIRPRYSTSRSTISRPIETVYQRRMKFQAAPPDDVDALETEPVRGSYVGPKRVVVLPNKQAVVLTPGPPRDGNSIYQTFHYVQNPYVSAHPRLRTSSTSSNASRNSSRNNSLRLQRGARQGQATPSPISYPPPPR